MGLSLSLSLSVIARPVFFKVKSHVTMIIVVWSVMEAPNGSLMDAKVLYPKIQLDDYEPKLFSRTVTHLSSFYLPPYSI